ncbi:DNA-processing protein DprA [Granulosicoccus sp. 3-233]|uniref:DNA-processing protein DprA n=1 Tax=Granulosicoccus sp. 3-233 TaxID=3417969 RepID=UPI003D34536C
MDDATPLVPPVPTDTWLRFALAFSDSTRLCRHLRKSCPEPAATGDRIHRYLNHRDSDLPELLQGLIDEQQLAALFSDATSQRCEQALAWQAQSPRNHLLGLDHPAYPTLLQNTDDAPPLLYARGSLSALDYPLLAVVGSRKASHAALMHTRRLCHELASMGIGIVSGLAMGVDAAAHQSALQAREQAGNAGPTVAIAATPANRVYPGRHTELDARIVDSGGLVLTEYPLGSPTRPWHFPRRNRLISGISLGVLVAEAGLPSGTLTTATHAMNQGREVMAVPGSISNLQARGCHFLIKQGAALIEETRDVIEVLGPSMSQVQAALTSGTERVSDDARQHELALDQVLISPEEQALLDTLKAGSATLDELMVHATLSTSRLASVLGLLETKGLITTTAGGRYACC